MTFNFKYAELLNFAELIILQRTRRIKWNSESKVMHVYAHSASVLRIVIANHSLFWVDRECLEQFCRRV